MQTQEPVDTHLDQHHQAVLDFMFEMVCLGTITAAKVLSVHDWRNTKRLTERHTDRTEPEWHPEARHGNWQTYPDAGDW